MNDGLGDQYRQFPKILVEKWGEVEFRLIWSRSHYHYEIQLDQSGCEKP